MAKWARWSLAGAAIAAFHGVAGAQTHVTGGAALSKEEELAKQLANPIAALISVPFQLNYDGDSSTFLQPFVTYTTPDAWSFSLLTESTYEWKSETWSVPIVAVASKVTKIGSQLVSVGGGVRYWAEPPDGGPHGWGARLIFTLLFPK